MPPVPPWAGSVAGNTIGTGPGEKRPVPRLLTKKYPWSRITQLTKQASTTTAFRSALRVLFDMERSGSRVLLNIESVAPRFKVHVTPGAAYRQTHVTVTATSSTVGCQVPFLGAVASSDFFKNKSRKTDKVPKLSMSCSTHHQSRQSPKWEKNQTTYVTSTTMLISEQFFFPFPP